MQQESLIKLKFIKVGQSSGEPLGTHVLKNYLEICKNPKHHRVYFENLFSSYLLICGLATKGFMATGLMRNDRIMNCLLVDVKKMRQNERGSLDFRSDGNIEIVRWNDNPVVTIGSNAYDV